PVLPAGPGERVLGRARRLPRGGSRRSGRLPGPGHGAGQLDPGDAVRARPASGRVFVGPRAVVTRPRGRMISKVRTVEKGKTDDVHDLRALHRREGPGLRRRVPGRLHLRGRADAVHPPGRVRGLRRLRARLPRHRDLLRRRRARRVEAVHADQRGVLQRVRERSRLARGRRAGRPHHRRPPGRGRVGGGRLTGQPAPEPVPPSATTTRKEAPPPGRGSTQARPPSSSANRATSPIPTPGEWLEGWGPCRNGSKIASRSSSGIPGPSSSTAMRTPPSDGSTRTQTLASSGVCLAVFASRFSTIRSSLAASTLTTMEGALTWTRPWATSSDSATVRRTSDP